MWEGEGEVGPFGLREEQRMSAMRVPPALTAHDICLVSSTRDTGYTLVSSSGSTCTVDCIGLTSVLLLCMCCRVHNAQDEHGEAATAYMG
eukprot:3809619-Pyramimonas_sp.AAC.1